MSPAKPDRAERIVVTLTTIPARASKLGPVLRSLLHQSEPADCIVLALPHRTRSGALYPAPGALGLPPGIEILRCDDQGPATKLLPALLAEPNAVLVVVDDDVVYPRSFIETLLREHRRQPRAALGFRGVSLHPGRAFAVLDHVFATAVQVPARVDVLFGTWGYLLPPGTLPPEVHDLSAAPPEIRFVDDIWISGQLARAGVPRFVVPSADLPVETWNALTQSLTLGVNRSGENDEVALKHFAKDW